MLCCAVLCCAVKGPVCRLLLSCQSLASSSIKAALFCCLAGTQQQTVGASCGWGQQHWHHFLLLLHAIKRLTAGSWKATIKDWASAKGARLPLQCAHDLLGNVYNCDLAQLSHITAVVNSKRLLLATAAVGGGGGDVDGGGHSSSAGQRPLAEKGSVSAALDVLVEGGPSGLSVDMDDLMGMIMTQFHSGQGLPGGSSKIRPGRTRQLKAQLIVMPEFLQLMDAGCLWN
jgi:hypothetical protein